MAASPSETHLFPGRCAGRMPNLDLPPVAAEVGETDPQQMTPRQLRLRHRRPLDEGNGLGVEVVVQQRRILALEPTEPVEVEVGDRQPPAVALTDREGGRGDRPLDSKRPAGAADQGRLPGPEIAAEEDDVAGAEPGGDPR